MVGVEGRLAQSVLQLRVGADTVDRHPVTGRASCESAKTPCAVSVRLAACDAANCRKRNGPHRCGPHLSNLVPRPGLEPGTCSFTVRRSDARSCYGLLAASAQAHLSCRHVTLAARSVLRRYLCLSTGGYRRNVSGHATLPRIDLLAVLKAGQTACDDRTRCCEARKPLAHHGKWRAHLFRDLQVEALSIFFQALQGFDHGTYPRLQKRGKASVHRSTTSEPSPGRDGKHVRTRSGDAPSTWSIDSTGAAFAYG